MHSDPDICSPLPDGLPSLMSDILGALQSRPAGCEDAKMQQRLVWQLRLRCHAVGLNELVTKTRPVVVDPESGNESPEPGLLDNACHKLTSAFQAGQLEASLLSQVLGLPDSDQRQLCAWVATHHAQEDHVFERFSAWLELEAGHDHHAEARRRLDERLFEALMGSRSRGPLSPEEVGWCSKIMAQREDLMCCLFLVPLLIHACSDSEWNVARFLCRSLTNPGLALLSYLTGREQQKPWCEGDTDMLDTLIGLVPEWTAQPSLTIAVAKALCSLCQSQNGNSLTTGKLVLKTLKTLPAELPSDAMTFLSQAVEQHQSVLKKPIKSELSRKTEKS